MRTIFGSEIPNIWRSNIGWFRPQITTYTHIQTSIDQSIVCLFNNKLIYILYITNPVLCCCIRNNRKVEHLFWKSYHKKRIAELYILNKYYITHSHTNLTRKSIVQFEMFLVYYVGKQIFFVRCTLVWTAAAERCTKTRHWNENCELGEWA